MTLRWVLTATAVLATALSAQDIGPAPGQLVDVGGRKLHLMCSGTRASGAPTVVIEAGASAFSIDFTLVQQEVGRTNRVCSYDRAGSAWSEPVPPGGPATISKDLHALLQTAGERPPYVMVGASMGGLYGRTYDADYPNEVAGFVFIDPATEDRLYTMLQGQPVLIASLTAEQMRATPLPMGTVRVPKRRPQVGAPFDKLPPELYALRIKLDEKLIASGPDSVTPDQIADYREAERARLARLAQLRDRANRPFADRPVVVLTRGVESSPDLQASHAGVARLSSNSRHTVVANAGHEIHLFEPAAVIQAIADVSAAVRDKKPLPPR